MKLLDARRSRLSFSDFKLGTPRNLLPLIAASSLSGAMSEPSKKEEFKEEPEEKVTADSPRELIWNAFLEALDHQ